jgi:hypothetical protein
MTGKAARSPVLEVRGHRERSQCVLARSRGNVEQRGAFPWGAHQRDRANATSCGHGTRALDDVGCRLPTVRSVLASVEVGALCGPERGTAGREDSLHTFPA